MPAKKKAPAKTRKTPRPTKVEFIRSPEDMVERRFRVKFGRHHLAISEDFFWFQFGPPLPHNGNKPRDIFIRKMLRNRGPVFRTTMTLPDTWREWAVRVGKPI